jgi:DNA-binding Lrp family transcriptional regulator
MITAIVLIDAEVARIPEVAQEVAELEGITEVYSVTGNVDLIALARVRRHEDLAEVVANRIGKVDGVLGMQTYIAFQAYSTHDLEAAFAIGLED